MYVFLHLAYISVQIYILVYVIFYVPLIYLHKSTY